jgi:hypothetical protein
MSTPDYKFKNMAYKTNTYPKIFAAPVVFKICNAFLVLITIALQAFEDHIIFLHQ